MEVRKMLKKMKVEISFYIFCKKVLWKWKKFEIEKNEWKMKKCQKW
jgi:hypothetical protein